MKLARNLTGARLPGGIERKGAVAMVFKAVSLGPPPGERGNTGPEITVL